MVLFVKLSVQEIIEITGGKIISEAAEGEFASVNSLAEAEAKDASFLGNQKYYQDFLTTKAGLVLVPAGLPDKPTGPVLIEVENPSYAFGELVKKFASRQRVFKPGVHPRAIVGDDVIFNPDKVSIMAGAVIEDGCEIGDGTQVCAGAVVSEGVKIGQDCLIGANATVREFCELGNRVSLQPGCVIGSDGYGYELVNGKHEKVDQLGIVVIEDDVEIGANTTIDRARFGKTVIGEGSKIDNLVQIAHNVKTGKHCLVVAQTGIAGSSELGNYVTIAAQAGVAGHLTIGDQAVILSRGGVTKSLEGGAMYHGLPARPVAEEHKRQAYVSKIPKLMAEIKELKAKLNE
ncbi:UDP-3-O-[3-hydroxymyristoyl] glucosamine N-acyltransferase [Rubritalea squalenifaciens DSM 18772]|uniref:UDP-3-O-acylglucosamine N-acyltransferase n=1 Tax=Rubritalea squalenifaciens DSM 18772 TaxID=1123071 RepID=A0A1M6IGX1_9BACT|nr:UDP-3-O-(3-hydroxymyristoyl)glucosamine N-acyltransferase [Rubritalea squalenifaciens]SHJ33687.1 UDP-3-O-[3-hydroxymyristoyl] glucosamine N-acyltransferase [Rubritalea squalenifaciens DSM 18772]